MVVTLRDVVVILILLTRQRVLILVVVVVLGAEVVLETAVAHRMGTRWELADL